MKKQLIDLLATTKTNSILFAGVISFIETHYQHTPTPFKNGETYNEATQNQGSAKVFAFAKLNDLGKADTLSLFAEHYQSVLANPTGVDHQNIRQFMRNGWEGISFDGEALISK